MGLYVFTNIIKSGVLSGVHPTSLMRCMATVMLSAAASNASLSDGMTQLMKHLVESTDGATL